MKCPYCGYEESKVIDSRPTDEGERIRRRRECLKCEKRFTTYEIIEKTPLLVIKKDNSRESFDREKLMKGMISACDKRAVSIQTISQAVDEIEKILRESDTNEISTQRIGELAMQKLRGIDEVAYVRFASVYKKFTDVGSFKEEISNLEKNK
jgi:transcriptional repressor NrdR